MKDTNPTSNSGPLDHRVEFIENGDIGYVLSNADLDRFDTTTRKITFECSSGDLITGRWNGIVLGDVLDELSLPGDTTHLLVEARDGHKACLGIHSALDALLAFDRLDESERTDSGLPRLLRYGLEGPRTLKWVRRIRPLHLSTEERPEDFEPLPPSVEDESG